METNNLKTLFCYQCGRKLSDNERFCVDCGAEQQAGSLSSFSPQSENENYSLPIGTMGSVPKTSKSSVSMVFGIIGVIMMGIGFFLPIINVGFAKFSVFDMLKEQVDELIWLPIILGILIIFALVVVFIKPSLLLISGIGNIIVWGVCIIAIMEELRIEAEELFELLVELSSGFYLSVFGSIILIVAGFMAIKEAKN